MSRDIHCPFCIGGKVSFIVDGGTAKARHTKPACREFKEATDALAFIAAVNNVLTGKKA